MMKYHFLIRLWAFFGDWQALNIFDSDIYDDEPASICETQIGQFRNSDGGGYILGHNYYVDGATEYNANKIAIKGSETGKNVTAAVSLLRNADKLTFSVDDSEGNTVYSESSTKVSKKLSFLRRLLHTNGSKGLGAV